MNGVMVRNRCLVLLASLVLLTFYSEGGRAAQEGAKIPPAEMKKIAADLYFDFDYDSSNSIIWATEEGVLVIDTRQHPRCGIITEPFATQAEEKNIGVRPLKAKPGAKPVPITVAFWNSDWAKKNDSAARAFMNGYLRAVRDLSEPNAWKAPVHTEIISKHTGVAAAVLLKTRAPVFSPNLELEEKEMMSQQEFNLRLGYLKYKEMKPIKELVDLSYAEAAVKQAGRK